ncbi:hypothetical protein ACERII_12445 [Evansella sp. AB-rgal1]|uniref:hypothetical protein n=1 Tax=Evansella sp. AB-rgal1 TaxID=3242696 RepID=UPI00359DBDE0
MSLVYSEVEVKKKPWFSAGDPEPQLRVGELFIYMTKDGEYIPVEAEKTPVSNAFIKSRKICRRIKMNAGPFHYSHGDEYVTRNHREQLRVEVTLKLEIVDPVKLYHANIKDITSYLHNRIPSFISSIIVTYDMDEISVVQQKFSDVEVFPQLISDVRNCGLRVAEYNARISKDQVAKQIDQKYRTAAGDLDIEAMQEMTRIKIKHDGSTMDKTYAASSKLELIRYFNEMLEELQSPTIVLELIEEEENKELMKRVWKEKGIYLEEGQEKATKRSSDIEDLMEEIDR